MSVGSSATDFVTDVMDVTDVRKKEEVSRKKEDEKLGDGFPSIAKANVTCNAKAVLS
ncbi:hypothetical protein Q5691_15210 [Microcoleus sp. w1-18aA5]|uniref:hypothetical protein n=1 Tax=unclassified Microcoleus TaxID=2642155 RepID=UPI002FCFF6EF